MCFTFDVSETVVLCCCKWSVNSNLVFEFNFWQAVVLEMKFKRFHFSYLLPVAPDLKSALSVWTVLTWERWILKGRKS